MERLKRAVAQIAATPDGRLRELPLLHRSVLLPLLSLTSSLYRLSLSLRRRVYALGLFSRQRLPVPVISVGNLTWGGNGKTPMVEFIARFLLEAGISPLILTRGYAGGDEVKMIQRHLSGTPTRIGVGANRTATATSIFRQHGYMKFKSTLFGEKLSSTQHLRLASGNNEVAVVILDDGMQLSEGKLKMIETKIRIIDPCSTIFFSRLAPSHFFEVKNQHSILPLGLVLNKTVLCVSGIGYPYAFAQAICKIGPSYVDTLDFDDHHSIQFHDIKLIKERLEELENRFKEKIIVVVTEKDYDRDPLILRELHDFDVLVLCCSLHIMTTKGQSEEIYKMKLKELLISKHGG